MNPFPILILLTCAAAAVCEENPSAVLDAAEQLTKEGKYEEALEKFVWFHDNAVRLDPSLYGVRLSFALGSWSRLASKYAPALDKMKAVNQANRKRLEQGAGDFALFLAKSLLVAPAGIGGEESSFVARRRRRAGSDR